MNNNSISDCIEQGDCAEVIQYLFEYVDGQLSDSPRTRIKAHIAHCEYCADAVDVESHFRVLLRAACSEHASADLRARILYSLRNHD